MKVAAPCPGVEKVVRLYATLFGFKLEKQEGCETCKCAPILFDGDVQVKHIPPIIRYIGMKAHCPCYYERDLKQQSAVDSQIECAAKVFNDVGLLHMLCNSPEYAPMFHPAFAKKLHENILCSLDCLNKYLEDKTYLVADRISLADFFRAYVAQCILAMVTEKEAAKYGNVVRHIKTVGANYPAYVEVCGQIEYAKQPFQPKPNKPEKPKEEKKEKAEAPKAEPADEKKEEKKAPKYVYKMDLNAWKRHYKNLDWGKQDWQDYFYQNFDGSDMSLWLLVYKDPSNFKVDWQTKNLFSILLQRLRGEKADQNSFGNFLVVKNPAQSHYQIIGVFLFAGQEIMAEYSDCSGCQSFDFIKIEDWKTPEAKAFIKNVWDWSETNDMVYKGVNYGKCTGDGETFV